MLFSVWKVAIMMFGALPATAMTNASDALSQYDASRRELIAQDRGLRVDHLRSWSDQEKRADEIVRDIRSEEANTVWNADYPNIPHPFPGMEFLTGKFNGLGNLIHRSNSE
jgi:hypothetical protein